MANESYTLLKEQRIKNSKGPAIAFPVGAKVDLPEQIGDHLCDLGIATRTSRIVVVQEIPPPRAARATRPATPAALPQPRTRGCSWC